MIEPVVDSTVDQLFVYGTLRWGDVRWAILEPFVCDAGFDDAVPGRLFDTGLGYPAAIFDDTDDRHLIAGRVVTLRHDRLDEALAVLDDEEDTVEGLYRRVQVRTANGQTVWAYASGDGLELTPIPSGDWLTR